MTDGAGPPPGALRDAYAGHGGPAAVFGRKVADYAASRPDYPAALFRRLADRLSARPGAPARRPVVVDVGAGTGLLTAGLLAFGADVLAVEPSAGMRAACDARLGGHPGYRSAAGTAESLPVADASVDLLAAAQAFHWFDGPRARAEACRVLAPEGLVALVWNDRLAGDPMHVAFDDLAVRFGGQPRQAMLAHERRDDVPAFFGAGDVEVATWPHGHRIDRPGLAALLFSRSYMPARDTADGRRLASEADDLFDRLADADGRVTVRYATVAWLGRPG